MKKMNKILIWLLEWIFTPSYTMEEYWLADPILPDKKTMEILKEYWIYDKI